MMDLKDTPEAKLPTHREDRRTRLRVPMKLLGGAAMLQAVAEPEKAILCRLDDVSAGGCCLVAARHLTSRLDPGDACIVTLPITKQGVPLPASLVDVESDGDSADDVRVHLRFGQADSVARQRMARWLAELSVRSWRTRSGQA